MPPPPLTIVTLGRFEVWQHGQSTADREWSQRKAGELFRLLLVTPDQTLTRDQIIEALWPDKSVAQALPLLHRATSTLRRVLEPDLPDKFPSRYLEVDEGRVTLHLPIESRLDFAQFEQQVKDQHWPEALALYGGELFPADRYADWAAAPRERLTQLYVQALLAQAQLDLEAAQFDRALELARRAITIEPWHEQAVLIAMRASLAQNDRPGAARLYHTLEQTLRDDLGLAPMPELRALHQTLLNP